MSQGRSSRGESAGVQNGKGAKKPDSTVMIEFTVIQVIHFRHSNDNGRCVYTLGSNVVKVVKEERDLGVIIHKSLKPTSQCIEAVKSANKTLGMISRTFMFNDKNNMLRLYKSLIRLKLEYSIQALRPYLKKDIDLLETIQRQATKLMFRGYLGLTTLETRRLRGDLIEVFKMFKVFEDVDYTHFFTCSQSQYRGHPYKLYKPYVKLHSRKFFFQFVLLMCGILCLRSYCSVVPYKRSIVIWTCVCIRGIYLSFLELLSPFSR